MRRTTTAPRWLLLTSVGAATMLTLTACAGQTEPADTGPTLSGEPVTLSFTWWGNDVRHGITEELIAAFEEEHPDVTVDWIDQPGDGYQDKILSQANSNTLPDVLTLPRK